MSPSTSWHAQFPTWSSAASSRSDDSWAQKKKIEVGNVGAHDLDVFSFHSPCFPLSFGFGFTVQVTSWTW